MLYPRPRGPRAKRISVGIMCYPSWKKLSDHLAVIMDRNTKGEPIMRNRKFVFGALALSVFGLHLLLAQNPMTFFITSKGPGEGANLGGLTGADKHCQNLAMAAGAG